MRLRADDTGMRHAAQDAYRTLSRDNPLVPRNPRHQRNAARLTDHHSHPKAAVRLATSTGYAGPVAELPDALAETGKEPARSSLTVPERRCRRRPATPYAR
ncbi:hypothetical protein ACSNOH_05720 [Streptomyces sp. URMC 127]|uniref:hypothetical protein n=1 Tax=Streptomyces sp. URMC 127 TaxID=3423402 RepID=UPI003F1A6DBC